MQKPVMQLHLLMISLDSFEELKTVDNATQAQMIMYSKLFKINFTKMDPYEFKTFTDILQRYSDLCKPVKGTRRGKKKINQCQMYHR